jgi:eukaryotic-like serine/threonine-protein kinase
MRAFAKDLPHAALRRYALGGKLFRDGLVEAPVASINYGAGGIAYAIYRIARRRSDPILLTLADAWIQKTFALAWRGRAFYNSDLGIERRTVGNVSLFHSASGLHCVRALINIATRDSRRANRAIASFVAASRRPCDNPDLTLGKASLLLACAELIEAMTVPWCFDKENVRSRGEEIADDLLTLVRSQDIATSKSITALGIAHGWGGLIFALLRWTRATDKNADPVVAWKLDELASLAQPHRRGLRWPVYNSNASAMFADGWCNGGAGHAMLFALAHHALPTKRFGEVAERAATSVWSSKMKLGDLCCGQGGIGYAMAALYRLTGSAVWLKRAHAAARRAAADRSKHFLRDALYKGAVGIAVLAEDLKQPETAAMPLFEPTR